MDDDPLYKNENIRGGASLYCRTSVLDMLSLSCRIIDILAVKLYMSLELSEE